MTKSVRLLLLIGSLFLMIGVNVASVALPLNGMTPKDLSDLYTVLFTPAGYVFSIWSVIYLGAIVWVFSFFSKKRMLELPSVIYFCLSSLLNSLWLLAWHYQWLNLSLILMTGLLIVLGLFYQAEIISKSFSWLNRFISVYLGWLTVAWLANISYDMVAVLEVSQKIQEVTSVIFLVSGVIISGVFLWRWNELLYPLVFVWAYSGIYHRLTIIHQDNIGLLAGVLGVMILVMTLIKLYLTLKSPLEVNPDRANK